MIEIWKDIEGYEGSYQVSNLGRVKSLERMVFNPLHGQIKIKETILKFGHDGFNYCQVGLQTNGRKNFKIHRLVAIAFIPNPENKREINHIDGNKDNNCIDNLEWVSSSENQIHAYKNNLRKPSRALLGRTGSECKTSKQICQFDLNGNFIQEFGSTREAERFIGMRNIYACATGKRKTLGGYKWKYKQQINN